MYCRYIDKATICELHKCYRYTTLLIISNRYLFIVCQTYHLNASQNIIQHFNVYRSVYCVSTVHMHYIITLYYIIYRLSSYRIRLIFIVCSVHVSIIAICVNKLYMILYYNIIILSCSL